MKQFPYNIFLVLVLLSTGFMNAQSVFGKWKTIDDRTGIPKGIIEIYKEGGLMYGRILQVVEKGKENAVCVKCDGDLKDKPVVGMTIIKGGKKNDDEEWKGKYLFDPEQAMTFRFKIWLNPDDPDELKVRGYLAFLYRTQTWVRHEG